MTLFSIPVRGVDQQHKDVSNDDNQAREVDGSQSNETAFVRSALENGAFDNRFGVSLNATNGPTLRLESSNVNDVKQSPNQANPSLSIVYKSIVEFIDSDGNGSYEPGIDTAVNSIDLQTLDYSSPELSRIVSEDGKQGWGLRTHSVNNLFTVSSKTFRETSLVDNVPVAPTASQITVTISHFPFRDPADRLALQTLVTSSTPIVNESVSGRTGVGFTSGTTREVLSWNPTGVVDNALRPVSVVAADQGSTGRVLISFDYPSGALIRQELFFGVSFGTTPLLNANVLIDSALVAIIVFALLVIVGRRRILNARLGRDFQRII